MTDVTLEKPLLIIKISETKARPQLFIAILSLVIGLLMIPLLIGTSILFFAVYFFQIKSEFIRIYESYSDINPGLACSRWFIPNKSIRNVRQEKKILIIDIEQNGKMISRKIPLQLFSESDAKTVVTFYKNNAEYNSQKL